MTDHASDALLRDLGLRTREALYENPLASAADIDGWPIEGPGTATFPLAQMRLESTGAFEAGQKSNFVLWCPEVFPDDIRITWQFRPIMEPGLAILFFAARGQKGEHVLDPALAPRRGPYNQYHSGDINALHVSYFRRRNPDEIRLHSCNLRKSHGFHLVAQGGDPIPTVDQTDGWYEITLIKRGPLVAFAIEGITTFTWRDDGKTCGPVLGEGSIGLRQMNPLIAEYRNLRVDALEEI